MFLFPLRLFLSRLSLIAVSLAGLACIIWAEHQLKSVAFVSFTTAGVAAVIFLLSRKLAFSVYTAWTLLAVITVVTYVKYKMDGVTLQAYDVVFVASDATMPIFLLTAYAHYAIPLVAFLVVGFAVLGVIAWFEEPRRIHVVKCILLVLVAAVTVPISFPAEATSNFYYMRPRYASSFLVSIRDLGNLWSVPAIVKRLQAMQPEAPYSPAFRCGDPGNRPDVVFVHAESAMPPSLMPAWRIGDAAMGDFRSDDGLVHRLGVEAFGGGSWITTMSILTGMSGADFDWMRMRITYALQGRIGLSVPEILRQCGYNTAAVLGMDYNFVNMGPFLASIGIENIFDKTAIQRPSLEVRDRYYFNVVLDLIRRNRATSDKPLFIYVETMFAHSPYDQRREADAVVPGEPFSGDPETNEYLRRLALARDDLSAFEKTLASDAGQRGFLMLEYGDHQPLVTRRNIEDDIGVETPLTDWRSREYATYFAVHSLGGAREIHMPVHERLDAAFLGYAFLQAAALASDGIITEIERLRVECDGYFHLCADREIVDRYLRRRLDSGLINLTDM